MTYYIGLEQWARNYLNSDLLVKDPSAQIYTDSGCPNPPVGGMFNNINPDTGLIVNTHIDAPATNWALVNMVKLYKHTGNTDAYTQLVSIADFITSNVVDCDFYGSAFKAFPNRFTYDSGTGQWNADIGTIHLRTFYHTIWSLLEAYSVTETPLYKTTAEDLIDAVALFFNNLKSRAGSEIPDWMTGAIYNTLNNSSGNSFTPSWNTFVNANADVVYRSINKYLELFADATRPDPEGTNYLISDLLNDHINFLADAYANRGMKKATGHQLLYPFYHYNYDDTADANGWMVPQAKAWDWINNIWGDVWIAGDMIAWSILGMALGGLTTQAEELITRYYELRMATGNNEILFYDRLDAEGIPLAEDSTTSTPNTALFMEIKDILGDYQYHADCIDTLASYQISSADPLIDGAFPWDTTISNSYTESKTLGEVVYSPIEKPLGYQIQKSKPIKDMCLFYGYPIAINEAWDISTAVNIYADYDIVTFGYGYQEPTHETHTDTVNIISGIKGQNPDTEIFGYVPIGQIGEHMLTVSQMKADVDNWESMGVTGIFLDEFSYDYEVTREIQNEIVSYIHYKGMNVIANSWNIDWVFSSDNLYLDWIDFYGNPNQLPAEINENDYYLFENMFYAFNDSGQQVASDQWRVYEVYRYYFNDNGVNEPSYYEEFGTKTLALDGILSDTAEKEQMFIDGYLGSIALNIDGYSASPMYWGASDVNYSHYDIANLSPLIEETGLKHNVTLVDFYGKAYSEYDTVINSENLNLIWYPDDTTPSDYTLGERKAVLNGQEITSVLELNSAFTPTQIFNFDTAIRAGLNTAVNMETSIKAGLASVYSFDTNIDLNVQTAYMFETLIKAGVNKELNYDTAVKAGLNNNYSFNTAGQFGINVVSDSNMIVNAGQLENYNYEVGIEVIITGDTIQILSPTKIQLDSFTGIVMLKAKDTLPSLRAILQQRDKKAIPLSNCEVNFIMKNTAGNIIVNEKAFVVDEQQGIVEYYWSEKSTEKAGNYLGEFEITYSNNKKITVPNNNYITIIIKE